MSGVAEASKLLKEISEPWSAGESLKAALNRVTTYVNKVGLKHRHLHEPMKVSRVEDIWRAEARLVRSEEMDAIRAARDAKLMREARAEYTDFIARLERIEAFLLRDEDDGRATADALRASGGGLDRSLDRGE